MVSDRCLTGVLDDLGKDHDKHALSLRDTLAECVQDGGPDGAAVVVSDADHDDDEDDHGDFAAFADDDDVEKEDDDSVGDGNDDERFRADVQGENILADTCKRTAETEAAEPLERVPSTYKIVGENIDKARRARFSRVNRKLEILPYFHYYAVKHRIMPTGLCDDVLPLPLSDAAELAEALPSAADDSALLSNIVGLTSIIVAERLTMFSQTRKHIVSHIHRTCTVGAEVNCCKCSIGKITLCLNNIPFYQTDHPWNYTAK